MKFIPFTYIVLNIVTGGGQGDKLSKSFIHIVM